MKTPATRRLLALALGLLALAQPPAPARADALADARASLGARDFAAAKTILDPLLVAEPANADAAVLRAIARLGLAVEVQFPAFVTKLGANRVNIDLGADTFDVSFPKTILYETGRALTLSSGTYRLASTYQNQDGVGPSISFENRAATPCTLVLQCDFGPVANVPFSGGVMLDDEDIGYLFIDSYGPHGQIFRDALSFDQDALRLTVVIPAGSSASIEIYSAGAGASFRPVTAPPSTLVVLNGKRVEEVRPRLSATANFSDLFTFAAQTDSATFAPVVADLAVAGPDFSLTLASSETGHATDTVITYPDIQLLLAEFKTFQAFRRVFNSYNFNQLAAPVLFSENGPETLLKNTAFLTPKAATAALNAERALARTLLQQAIQHYYAASDAGAWTRGAPASGGTYLFALGDEDPDILAAQKLSFETGLSQLEAALTGSVPLADLDDNLAADPALPDGAGASLAPLFGTPAVNLRSLMPRLSSEGGIVPGTSTKLLASGLLPGVGTAWWESYLAAHDITDLSATPVQTGPAIQRQPVATTVAEGDDATLSIVAECYPAPTYQWFRRDGLVNTPLDGETTPVLVLPAATREDAGTYFVRVTNTRSATPPKAPVVASLNSAAVKLTVTYAPEIATHPASQSWAIGKTVTFTVAAAGVPAPAYQWRKDGVNIKGAVSPTYRFTANAASSGDYDVVVTNSRGSATSDPAALVVTTKPVITRQPAPAAKTLEAGADLALAVTAVGPGPLSYQWFLGEEPLPGATGPSLDLADVTAADNGKYRVLISNDFGETSSAVVTLTVNFPPSTLAVGAALALTGSGTDSRSGAYQLDADLAVSSAGKFADNSTFTYTRASSRAAKLVRTTTVLQDDGYTRKTTGTYTLTFQTETDATYVEKATYSLVKAGSPTLSGTRSGTGALVLVRPAAP